MPHLREHGIHHFCVSKECLCRNSAKRMDYAKIVHSILVESQCRLVSRLSDPCGNTPSQYCISGICISTPRYTVAELCGILTRLPCYLLRTILSVIYRNTDFSSISTIPYVLYFCKCQFCKKYKGQYRFPSVLFRHK